MNLVEVAVGLEISEDRRHTSVVAAGGLGDELVGIELLHYLDGTAAAVATVSGLYESGDRHVGAVAVDPRGFAANLVKALDDAGVPLVLPSTVDMQAAHAGFLDALAAGRLRHDGSEELTAAVRFAQQRKLTSGATWQRRGTAADASPLVAATLALWAFEHEFTPPADIF